MSGFSNFFTRFFSTPRVIPVATQEQEQVQLQAQAQAPRNYMFTDETDITNRPSFNYVLTGTMLRGEEYRQDLHNVLNSVNGRNKISYNQRNYQGGNFTYYYNPETLRSAPEYSALRESALSRVSALSRGSARAYSALRNSVRRGSAGRGSVDGGSAGRGSARIVPSKQEIESCAKQALKASIRAREISLVFNNKVNKYVFECPICFEVIDPDTPKDTVRVCENGNVFHSICPALNQPDTAPPPPKTDHSTLDMVSPPRDMAPPPTDMPPPQPEMAPPQPVMVPPADTAPEFIQTEETSICPSCRSEKLFIFVPKQKGGFKSSIKHIKKQKQSRKPKNRSVNQTRKRRKH